MLLHMKFGMSTYKMHFNCTWKNMCSQEVRLIFVLTLIYFGRFYLAHFKLKWVFLNICRGAK
jgi:hypothetical protein